MKEPDCDGKTAQNLVDEQLNVPSLDRELKKRLHEMKRWFDEEKPAPLITVRSVATQTTRPKPTQQLLTIAQPPGCPGGYRANG